MKGNKEESAMETIQLILFVFLIVCAVTASLTKNTLSAIVIFGAYSLVMSIIWITMESPDLAITEAAVGAGVTTILFYATLKKINQIDMNIDDKKEKKPVTGGR